MHINLTPLPETTDANIVMIIWLILSMRHTVVVVLELQQAVSWFTTDNCCVTTFKFACNEDQSQITLTWAITQNNLSSQVQSNFDVVYTDHQGLLVLNLMIKLYWHQITEKFITLKLCAMASTYNFATLIEHSLVQKINHFG